MPRKPSDKIYTYRFELSPKERDMLEDIIKTQKENQRLDAVTNTFQAVGVGLSGGGFLVAGLALAAWFGYNFKDEIIDTTKGFVDGATDVVMPIVTGKTKEQMAEDIMQSYDIDIEELLKRQKELNRQKNRFCNPTSQYYDEIECARVDAEIQQLKQAISNARETLNQEIESGGITNEIGKSILYGILRLPRNTDD